MTSAKIRLLANKATSTYNDACITHNEKPWSHAQNSNTTPRQLPQYMHILFAKLWSLYVLKSAQGQNLCICNMLCGRQFIYFIHTTCTVWFIFPSGKWRNTNDKKLDRTNCRNKRDDTTVMNSNCSQINQSTGMYSQSNIGKFPAYLIGFSLILYLP